MVAPGTSRPTPTIPYDEVIVKADAGPPLGRSIASRSIRSREEQSRWLAFKNKAARFHQHAAVVHQTGVAGRQAAPELAAGHSVQKAVDPEYTYTYFQWNDPVWGGLELPKVALRRAIAYAINRDEEIEIIRKGNAKRAEFIIPKASLGIRRITSPASATTRRSPTRLLDKFGYKKAPTAIATRRTANVCVQIHLVPDRH